MNGKPQALRELTSGLAIGAGQNEGFVDTFNWLVRFCDNLKGDNTFITLENEFGDHPRIVFDQTKLFGLGGGGSDYTPYPAPFDFDKVSNKIINCVWYMGREVRLLADYTIDTTTSKTYWLKIETDSYGQFSQASIIPYTYTLPINGGAIASPTNTDQYTHYPLWSIQVSNGTITPAFDWRQAWKTPFYST